LAEAEVPFAVDGVAAAILYGFPLPGASVQLRIQDDPEILRGFVRALDLQRDTNPGASPSFRDIATPPTLAYIYDLRDPDAHWLARFVPLQVRTQLMDPRKGAVAVTVRCGAEEETVFVVPLRRIVLPRRYARALERMRERLTQVAEATRLGCVTNGELSR
jgi:hypothetical protein